jgi:hypothetical protein
VRSHLQNNYSKKVGSMAQAIEHLLSKAQSPEFKTPNTIKTKIASIFICRTYRYARKPAVFNILLLSIVTNLHRYSELTPAV